MTTLLDQLKRYSTVVADTGDLEAIRRFSPQDATTNPSLILKAVQSGQYDALIDQVIKTAQASTQGSQKDVLEEVCDRLIVAMGCEILKAVPGRVSTEVSAHLSFDSQASINKARQLVALYNDAGIPNERILIKLAATWEGICAAEVLEQEGIQCNLTLIFNFAQARACAEAGVYLISPFVGRILDWYKHKNPHREYSPYEEPGVQSVTSIYHYFRRHQYSTVVMGASFRNSGEIIALAGCDRLTISPALLEELASRDEPLTPALKDAGDHAPRPNRLGEADFRWAMNQDPMATDKLAEGIRGFDADLKKLETLLSERMAN